MKNFPSDSTKDCLGHPSGLTDPKSLNGDTKEQGHSSIVQLVVNFESEAQLNHNQLFQDVYKVDKEHLTLHCFLDIYQ